MKKSFLALALIVASATASIAQNSKVGHVNMTKISDTIPSRKVKVKEYTELSNLRIKDINDLDSSFQVAYNIYLQKEAGMSDISKQMEQQKLQRMQATLQQEQASFQQDMEKLEGEMIEKYIAMVKEAVKIVATRQKLNYVIDESSTLYSTGGVDITNEVIKEVLILDLKNK